MPDALDAYFREIARVHSSRGGVDETSYYSALNQLLSEIGRDLSPQVNCVMGLRNLGAGLPDGGLFTADQVVEGISSPVLAGQLPARGAIEAKPVADDVRELARSQQARDYLGRYGKLLVTTFREFVLVVPSHDGSPRLLEEYSFAPDADSFWTLVRSPRKATRLFAMTFTDYIKRVMTYGTPIASPRDLASILAAYARQARNQIDMAPKESLEQVRNELSEVLGVEFEGARGETFFRSAFVQALFYGLYSAWVLWSQEPKSSKSPGRFEWKKAAWSLNIPMIGPLFAGMTMPNRLGPLNLAEILDWTEDALNRVDREPFFKTYQSAHAVQYFYEPFLEAFDPELRKELGVWYTPAEIVDYMVARVDQSLIAGLGIEDGLADPRVIVLDPCCGTGSYLVAILRRIKARVAAKYGEALAGAHLKQMVIERLFGFEILPAPFVVSHLQIGLYLKLAGVSLDTARGERAGVFLTNSLTGWSPPEGPQSRLTGYFDLEREREAACDVKRAKRILVVIGNPPYNAFAGVSPAEEQGLVELYKEGLVSEWKIRKFNLDELYARFYRIAERRIVDQTGAGIICYITNFSYVGHPSFVVMRQRLLPEFQQIWIDNLNGDSRENKKLTPLGEPDPSIFSTPSNREGIRVGTAIGLFIRKGELTEPAEVRYRELWGREKRRELLDSIDDPDLGSKYGVSHPTRRNRFTFKSESGSLEYDSWPSLVELAGIPPFSGPQEGREKAFIVPGADRMKLETIKSYLDPKKSDEEIRTLEPRLMKAASRFDPVVARRKIISGGVKFNEAHIVPYFTRPLDLQVAYLDPQLHPAFYWPRPELVELTKSTKTRFLASRDTAHVFLEGVPVCYMPLIADYHSVATVSKLFPFRIGPERSPGKGGRRQSTLSGKASPGEPRANLSETARAYLRELGLGDPDTDASVGDLVWLHSIAITFSPSYLLENRTGVRQGWPRVPLPDSPDALRRSALLGERVATYLDPTVRVPSVTSGAIRQDLALIGILARIGGGTISQENAGLTVTASWGHGTTVVMPGRGKVVRRAYSSEELDAVTTASKALGPSVSDIINAFGEETLDVYLNKTVYWSNIPTRVWSYTIGGSQVIKKWLSYRESSVLGRSLQLSEATTVTDMARRLAALRLLEQALNANFEYVREHTFSWPELTSTSSGLRG